MIKYHIKFDKLTDKCPIWGTPAFFNIEPNNIFQKFVISPRAGGKFYLSDLAEYTIKEFDAEKKALLTSWILRENIYGQIPTVSEPITDQIATFRPKQFGERLDDALQFLDQICGSLGATVDFLDAAIYPAMGPDQAAVNWMHLSAAIESKNNHETKFLIEYLRDEQYIKTADHNRFFEEVAIIGKGYQRLDQLQSSISADTKKAFVAMWFDPSMKDPWDIGIRPGVEDAGFYPIRIDQKEHNNKIDDEIIAEIRESRFIIADFTSNIIDDGKSKTNIARGGVYYEAGFAQGLGIPVIWTCRNDVIDYVHFDTRQFAHIVWESPEDLREKLTRRIRAVIGLGPLFKSE